MVWIGKGLVAQGLVVVVAVHQVWNSYIVKLRTWTSWNCLVVRLCSLIHFAFFSALYFPNLNTTIFGITYSHAVKLGCAKGLPIWSRTKPSDMTQIHPPVSCATAGQSPGNGMTSRDVVRPMTYWGVGGSCLLWEIHYDFHRDPCSLLECHAPGLLTQVKKYIQYIASLFVFCTVFLNFTIPRLYLSQLSWVWISSSGHYRYHSILGDERCWTLNFRIVKILGSYSSSVVRQRTCKKHIPIAPRGRLRIAGQQDHCSLCTVVSCSLYPESASRGASCWDYSGFSSSMHSLCDTNIIYYIVVAAVVSENIKL